MCCVAAAGCGSPEGTASLAETPSITSTWLIPTRLISVSLPSLSPEKCTGGIEAEVLIFRYSVKLEFENQSVPCSCFSSSKQKYQLWFADFCGIFGKKKKKKISFSTNTQKVALILYASLTSPFTIYRTKQKVWQLFPFPCKICSNLLCLLVYLKSCNDLCNSYCLSPTGQQWTVMLRILQREGQHCQKAEFLPTEGRMAPIRRKLLRKCIAS